MRLFIIGALTTIFAASIAGAVDERSASGFAVPFRVENRDLLPVLLIGGGVGAFGADFVAKKFLRGAV